MSGTSFILNDRLACGSGGGSDQQLAEAGVSERSGLAGGEFVIKCCHSSVRAQ
jgi:hypothetical protein